MRYHFSSASCPRTTMALFACLYCTAFSLNPAFGQGLLGHKFLSSGYRAQRPNDHDLRAISSWSHGVEVLANLPLSENLDWYNVLLTESLSGSTLTMGGTPFSAEMDVVQLISMATWHFKPYGNIDPYVGLGAGYADATIEIESAVASAIGSDDDFGVVGRAGIEWRLAENSAVQTEIHLGDSVEDFSLSDALVDNIYFETRMIHWWSNQWFGGFTIGSDFDDTEIALGVFLGFGQR